MATIRRFPLLPLRHCQGEAHTYILRTRGTQTRGGRGIGFWFWPVGIAISEVPLNDQSVPVTLKCRTKDFQEVVINAQVWYTVADAQQAAQRFDFSINSQTGKYNADPLTVIQGALSSNAQETVWSYVAGFNLEALLEEGLDDLSTTVATALSGLDFGISVSRAVVMGVRPERAVEQALQAKTRERLQMEADAAAYERRAKATEQERAIQEAELANKLALAQQREELIQQEDANAQMEANSEAAVQKIGAQSKADADQIRAQQEVMAQRARDALRLETKGAEQAQEVAYKRELVDMKVDETAKILQLHAQSPEAAQALALAKLPDGLGNLRVLTIGEGGLQAALERMAGGRNLR